METRFHKGRDGWGRDSYSIPQFAVAGASDTGTWSDSPANSKDVDLELGDFKKYLSKNGIRSRFATTESGNVFMSKRWVTVSEKDFPKASQLALAYLAENETNTRLIHDADLEPSLISK